MNSFIRAVKDTLSEVGAAIVIALIAVAGIGVLFFIYYMLSAAVTAIVGEQIKNYIFVTLFLLGIVFLFLVYSRMKELQAKAKREKDPLDILEDE